MNEIIIAVVVAIAPTILALSSLIATLRLEKRSNTKLDHITTLTNSTLTAANTRIEFLENKIFNLESGKKRKAM